MDSDEQDVAIYLDYNASCPLHPHVIDAMRPFLFQHYGNPSSSHIFGSSAKTALDEARKNVAKLLGAKESEVIFTSGGTESINFALKGTAFAQRLDDGTMRKTRIVTSAVEHPAVSETLEYLKRFGFEIVVVPVDSEGTINLEALEEAITDSTFLVTIMHANNEVGTIQPIAEVSRIAKMKNPYITVHTDASQSVGKIETDVNELGVDLLTVAGHKLYAPKGVGALYIRQGTRIDKYHHGAGHESGRRAGTENVLLNVGLGEACVVAKSETARTAIHCKAMRDRLLEQLNKHLEGHVHLNGHLTNRLPNTLSVSFPGIQASTLLSNLKTQVAASAGSACHSGKVSISAVLKAMGVPEDRAIGTVRFSTGRWTTADEVDKAAEIVANEVKKLKSEAH